MQRDRRTRLIHGYLELIWRPGMQLAPDARSIDSTIWDRVPIDLDDAKKIFTDSFPFIKCDRGGVILSISLGTDESWEFMREHLGNSPDAVAKLQEATEKIGTRGREKFRSFLRLAEYWLRAFENEAEARACLANAEQFANGSWTFMYLAKKWVELFDDREKARYWMDLTESTIGSSLPVELVNKYAIVDMADIAARLLEDSERARRLLERAESENDSVSGLCEVAEQWMNHFDDDTRAVQCLEKAEKSSRRYQSLQEERGVYMQMPGADIFGYSDLATAWMAAFPNDEEAQKRARANLEELERWQVYREAVEPWVFAIGDRRRAHRCIKKIYRRTSCSGLVRLAQQCLKYLNDSTGARRCLEKAQGCARGPNELKSIAEAWVLLLNDRDAARNCINKIEQISSHPQKHSVSKLQILAECQAHVLGDMDRAKDYLVLAQERADTERLQRSVSDAWKKIRGETENENLYFPAQDQGDKKETVKKKQLSDLEKAWVVDASDRSNAATCLARAEKYLDENLSAGAYVRNAGMSYSKLATRWKSLLDDRKGALRCLKKAEMNARTSNDYRYLAQAWIQLDGDTKHVDELLRIAEKRATYAYEYTEIASVWKEHSNNLSAVERCLRSAEQGADSYALVPVANKWNTLMNNRKEGRRLMKRACEGMAPLNHARLLMNSEISDEEEVIRVLGLNTNMPGIIRECIVRAEQWIEFFHDWKRARICMVAAEKGNGDTGAYIYLAKTWYEYFDERKRVRHALVKAEERSDGTAMDYLHIAEHYFNYLDDKKNSVRVLRIAESMGPDRRTVQFIATMWMELGDKEGALRCLKRMESQDASLSSLESMAEHYMSIAHDSDEASRCLIQAEERATTIFHLLRLAEKWIRYFGDMEKATALLERAEDEAPGFDEMLGLARHWDRDLGERDRSLQCLRRAAQLAVTADDFMKLAENWFEKAHDEECAKEYLNEAEQLAAESAQDFKRIAGIWQRRFGDLEQVARLNRLVDKEESKEQHSRRKRRRLSGCMDVLNKFTAVLSWFMMVGGMLLSGSGLSQARGDLILVGAVISLMGYGYLRFRG